MVAARFCRPSINTVRSFSSTSIFKSSLLPSTRTCKARPIAPTPRLTFSNRNFFATMAIDTPYVTLNDGNKMPQVGFGLWKVDNATCADTVYNAIKTGYRLFDGACDYGNEVEAGQGVARAIKEGLVKREDLFIVSKLWQTFHDYEQVEPITKKQLKDWGIDYFDLYLIHFPVALKYVSPETRYPPGWYSDDANSKIIHSNARLEDTWRAFEDIKQKGLTKSIGVSNYSGALLLDLFTYAKVKPATLQIEHHPYYVQPYLIKLAEEHDIKVTAYSSFGPQSFIECDMKIAADTPLLFDHPVIKKIAEAHGKTPAQVLLRWSTQRGLSVIPKSNSQNRLQQNLDVTGFDLKDSEISDISDLDKNLKFNAPTNYGIPCYVFA
ncbi:NADP-dependent oxidoreductase domain-containing protein [Paraphoma chrysanthemicola]|uniref:NADP-dependent oxidoreductase domain-containing protein n=1 Tax=Paraphoma chrysanthemicola TaxID=798071 RepID=A0A8K0QZ86_9PLEO|nr:NADP-dependent oxidoreductase domain-containing protein [Paraphoma chrysanthemicola]